MMNAVWFHGLIVSLILRFCHHLLVLFLLNILTEELISLEIVKNVNCVYDALRFLFCLHALWFCVYALFGYSISLLLMKDGRHHACKDKPQEAWQAQYHQDGKCKPFHLNLNILFSIDLSLSVSLCDMTNSFVIILMFYSHNYKQIKGAFGCIYIYIYIIL